MIPFIPSDPKRRLSYVATALFTASCCALTAALKPNLATVETLTIGFGYASLLLVALSLSIGPLNVFRQRRNPVNIMLRRDVGIGAGVTGLAHIVFGFQVHLGGDIVRYFFEKRGDRWVPLQDTFGLSNDLGTLAGLVLLVLLATSNDLSLRQLKGKRWKLIQRFNYALVILVVAHTLAYQVVINRERIMVDLTLALSVLIVALQAVGFGVTARRRARTGSARTANLSQN